MIKTITHILFALRFYVAVAIVAWILVPASHIKSEFNIVRFTYTAMQMMTAEVERLLQDRISETSSLRDVAKTLTALPDGGMAGPASQ